MLSATMLLLHGATALHVRAGSTLVSHNTLSPNARRGLRSSARLTMASGELAAKPIWNFEGDEAEAALSSFDMLCWIVGAMTEPWRLLVRRATSERSSASSANTTLLERSAA